MEFQENIRALNILMVANYQYLDIEMSAYLGIICNNEIKTQEKLFGHLIQFHWILGFRESIMESTFIDKESWIDALNRTESKYNTILDAVLERGVSLKPEEVGRDIADAIEAEENEYDKQALLAWILFYGREFVPWVTLPESFNIPRGMNPSEISALQVKLEEPINRINAINQAPLLKVPLMQAAALDKILEGITEPMERAFLIGIFASIVGPSINPHIKVMGIPVSIDKLSRYFERLEECDNPAEEEVKNSENRKKTIM
jgi:hypothetical protein